MPGRVIHGAGRISELPEEAEALGAKRIMFCCTKSRLPEVENIATSLGERFAGICDKAKIFVPLAAVDRAVNRRGQQKQTVWYLSAVALLLVLLRQLH